MKTVVERLKSVVSYSELKGIKVVIEALGDNDSGVVIASKLVGEAEVARSSIVNALKLLEVAGVVEARSLGMKGTYIKVLDRAVLNELVG